MTEKKKTGENKFLPFVVVAAILVVCLIAAGFRSSQSGADRNDTDADKNAVVVRDAELDAIGTGAFGGEVHRLDFESLVVDESGNCIATTRIREAGFDDALARPLCATTNPEELRDCLQAKFQGNPVLLYAEFQSYKEVSFIDGTTLYDETPDARWFCETFEFAHHLASLTTDEQRQASAPADWPRNSDGTVKVGVDVFCYKAEDGHVYLHNYKTEHKCGRRFNYKRFADSACLAIEKHPIERFSFGSWTAPAGKHWCHNGATTNVLCFAVAADYPESLPAFGFQPVRKDGSVIFHRGWNLKDSRPEVFDGSGEPPKSKKTTSRTTSKTTSKTTVTTKITKNTWQDPVNQGNANKGGGSNLGTDKYQDKQPSRQAVDPATANSSATTRNNTTPTTKAYNGGDGVNPSPTNVIKPTPTSRENGKTKVSDPDD